MVDTTSISDIRASKRLINSGGSMYTICEYLPVIETTKLQQLNKLFYEKISARIVIRFEFKIAFYFTWSFPGNFENVIFSVDPKTLSV